MKMVDKTANGWSRDVVLNVTSGHVRFVNMT